MEEATFVVARGQRHSLGGSGFHLARVEVVFLVGRGRNLSGRGDEQGKLGLAEDGVQWVEAEASNREVWMR